MEIRKDVDDFIKETIDESLGLPVSTQTLESKLRVYEETERRLYGRCALLYSKLKEKDELLERAKAEASMNAQALKRFVEENQRLAAECAKLLDKCDSLEQECSLYDRDRDAIMEFANEADERAKEAEMRVQELEEELEKLSEELQVYKSGSEKHSADSADSADHVDAEENLLESVLASMITEDGDASSRTFLEANSGDISCQKLLRMWDCLRPSTKGTLSLAAIVKTLKKENELLKTNLQKAEEEVNVLYEENKILVKEIKRLPREKSGSSSVEKPTSSSSTKSHKRKSTVKMTSPIEKKIGFEPMDSARRPLSPLQLQYTSLEC